jgi:RHS repeat-associated protein
MSHRYTGKERDAESGLDNFGARYYASPMGRFLSPDWADNPSNVPYGVFSNPQSLNLYAYVSNNPLKSTDSDGHYSCDPDTMSTNANGDTVVTAGGCHYDLSDFVQGTRTWLGNHPNTVKTVGAVVVGATAVSGLFDGGASELAVPEELAAEEALLEGGEVVEADTAETYEVGAKSVNTGKNINNWETPSTPDQVGKNLESQGFTKTDLPDGRVQYTKGDSTYTIYPKSQTTGGPSMQVKIGTKVVAKVRMK